MDKLVLFDYDAPTEVLRRHGYYSARPFARPRALAGAISEIRELHAAHPTFADLLLAQLPEYKSRGKGRGALSWRFGNPPGCYRPHQGRQERMRRLVGPFRGDKQDMVAKLQPIHPTDIKQRVLTKLRSKA